jgi:hypothetical protein
VVPRARYVKGKSPTDELAEEDADPDVVQEGRQAPAPADTGHVEPLTDEPASEPVPGVYSYAPSTSATTHTAQPRASSSHTPVRVHLPISSNHACAMDLLGMATAGLRRPRNTEGEAREEEHPVRRQRLQNGTPEVAVQHPAHQADPAAPHSQPALPQPALPQPALPQPALLTTRAAQENPVTVAADGHVVVQNCGTVKQSFRA